MTEQYASIDPGNLIARIQNRAQERDPGGLVDQLCALLALQQARIDDLERRLEDTEAAADRSAHLLGPSIERAIEKHVRDEWHR